MAAIGSAIMVAIGGVSGALAIWHEWGWRVRLRTWSRTEGIVVESKVVDGSSYSEIEFEFSGTRKRFTPNYSDNGFDDIQGFPIAFDFWDSIIHTISGESDYGAQNERLIARFDEQAEDDDWLEDPITASWRKDRDLQSLLEKHLFQKHDQVVVPALNLKASKVIVCRNERQKGQLRKLGFLGDRIRIHGISRSRWS